MAAKKGELDEKAYSKMFRGKKKRKYSKKRGVRYGRPVNPVITEALVAKALRFTRKTLRLLERLDQRLHSF